MGSPDDLKGELEGLKEEVRELKERLFHLEEEELLRSLKARGLKLFRRDPPDELLLPPNAPEEKAASFYEHLKRYSFRLLLRDVIRLKSFQVQDLTRYCSPQVASRYVDLLLSLGIIERDEEGFHLSNPLINSFGPTLEWFVAQIFKRDLCSSAFYGVRFLDTPLGGDFDVIALWQGRLIYVEIKSSPPRGIEQGEINAFLNRIRAVLPDCALLFNDTHLRMKDKLCPMLEEAIAHHLPSPSQYPLKRLEGEIFHINHRLYILNSKKEVRANLLLCLRDFLLFWNFPSLPLIP